MRNITTNRFSQRHYEAIAEVLAKSALETNVYVVRRVAKNLGAMFKADNPKFNWEKFLEKSGVGED
jgi:GTP-sensing pleiotropic transcriptional regulator CodY